MKRRRIISLYFFQKNCYHGNHIMHSVAPPKLKAIMLFGEQVGEIFSNSYITCYQERSSKYASLQKFCRADETKNPKYGSLQKFCRADETKNPLLDYCFSNSLKLVLVTFLVTCETIERKNISFSQRILPDGSRLFRTRGNLIERA